MKSHTRPALVFFRLAVNHLPTACLVCFCLVFLFPCTPISGQSQRLTHWSTKNGLSNNWVSEIMQDKQGFIWIGTQYGVNKFDGYEFRHFSNDPGNVNSLTTNWVRSMAEDASGHLWLGLYGGGLVRFNPATGKFTRFIFQDKNDHSLPGNEVHKVFCDSRNRVWVATFGGVAWIKPGEDYFHRVTESPAYDFQEDETQTIWLAAGNGLYFWKNDRFEPTGLFQGKQVYSVCPAKNGEGWVLSEDGLQFIEKQGNKWKTNSPVLPAAVHPNRHFLPAVFVDSRGKTWASSQDGIFRENKLNGTWELEEQLSGRQVHSFSEDRFGNIWVGTQGCLYRLHPKSLVFQQVLNCGTANSDDIFIDLTMDVQGQIWAGTLLSGLFCIKNPHLIQSADDLSYENYRWEKDEPASLSNDLVMSLEVTTDGKVWVGTDCGLNRLDPETGQFRRFLKKDGLLDEKITALTADRAGRIWASTAGQGLFCLDWEERIRHFSKQDGLASNDFLLSSVYRAANGKLMFGSTAGVAVFHPDSVLQERRVPTFILFTGFRLIGKTPEGRQDKIEPDSSINFVKKLVIPAGGRSFTLKFAAIGLSDRKDISYAYRLTNLNELWQDIGSSREITVAQIPPGEYTLQVRVQPHPRLPESLVASLLLVVKPPWHRTWWAYLLYTLTAAGLLYFLRRYELNRQLARAEARRLHELDQVKNRLYTNITHEFRTPLTLILGIADKLKLKVDYQAREELGVVTRNGRQLLDLVNQMLDLSKLESGSLALRAVQGDVVVFVKYLLESFQSLAGQKNIRLHWESPLDRFVMDYDPVRLQQIVVNFLSNAVKFTPDGGSVTLSLLAEGEGEKERLRITVADTGIGIPADKTGRIFERFYQVDDSTTRSGEGTGIGLTLARELARLHGGDISVESTPGEGSTFTVLLPVSRLAPAAKAPASLPEEIPVRPNNNGISTFATGNVAKPSLLVIEDNPDLTVYLASLLGHDYRIRLAPNGKAGLDRAQQDLPNVIISDVMMPEMDGYEVCRRLKDDLATCHIPIILLTAKSDLDSKITGLEQGADAYLPKPFNEAELRVWLKKLLESRERLRQLYTSGTFLSNQENILKPGMGLSGKDRAFLQQLQEKVEARFSNPGFTAEMLCGELHLGYHTCLRKVKALTGMNVNEYIQHVRINRAAQWLLEDRERSVLEIAEAVGFSSHNYFSRLFKNVMGCTPSEYRKARSRKN